jgi:S-adenosylmethionine-diacylglycerol 3-amino-3-carboxypropyl transferase
MTESLERLLASGIVRYSQVWEDHALLEDGLEITPDDDVLSIASAGCNVLALLLREPRSVTAVDLNPAQLALVELKLRAIEELTWEQFVRLIGVAPGDDRLHLYERVRPRLSRGACAHWDDAHPVIEAGIHWSGRLEAYFHGFAAEVLPRVHPPDVVARVLAMDDTTAQTRYFDEVFGVDALHSAFKSYFTRERIAGEGRDARQMRYVETIDVTHHFWQRFRWALTAIPTRGNYYLHSFMTGRYASENAVPPYLRRENFDRLRSLVPRVRTVLGEVGDVFRDAPRDAISKANLSDLFEYLSDEACAELFETLAARMRAGGRVCFWNLLVPREAPVELSARLRPLRALGEALHTRDRSWLYRSFHVDEVCSP